MTSAARRPARIARVAVASGAVLSAGVLAGCELSVHERDEVIEDVTVVDGPVLGVRVDVEAGRVLVRAGDADGARIEQTLRYADDAPELRQRIEDGVLIIDGTCADGSWLSQSCRIDLTVEVPARAWVEAATDVGELRIDAMQGRLELSTEAGRIVGHRLASGVVAARSDAGEIRLGFARAPEDVDARTDAGAVRLEVPHAAYDVEASSELGTSDVDVRDDDDAPRRLRARTEVGSVEVATSG